MTTECIHVPKFYTVHLTPHQMGAVLKSVQHCYEEMMADEQFAQTCVFDEACQDMRDIICTIETAITHTNANVGRLSS